MAIDRLALVNTATSGTYFAININGQDYRLSITELLDFVQNGITLPPFGQPIFNTQYAAPSSTGFNVQITNGDDNVHLILTPTAGFAAGTITLPLVAGAVDKQEVLVNCTQQVTALTVNGNGATVTGEPTALGADDFFRLKFDLPTQVWYRIG